MYTLVVKMDHTAVHVGTEAEMRELGALIANEYGMAPLDEGTTWMNFLNEWWIEVVKPEQRVDVAVGKQGPKDRGLALMDTYLHICQSDGDDPLDGDNIVEAMLDLLSLADGHRDAMGIVGCVLTETADRS